MFSKRRLIGLMTGLLVSGAGAAFAGPGDQSVQVEVVGPGVISSAAQEFGATMSPDGKTIYYTLSDNAYTHMTLMVSRLENGTWTTPEVAPFSGKWNDADSTFSPDGKRIYFISNKPAGDQFTGALEIWFVEKGRNGEWGPARVVPAIAALPGSKSYPSVAADGSVYFGYQRKIYVSRFRDGKHQAPEQLPFNSNAPSVAPDQSFIVIAQRGETPNEENLAISYFRDGEWSEPTLLPEPINSRFRESSPNISADGASMLFTSTRMDYSTISWPREATLTTYEGATAELQDQWENGLRNVYRVELDEIISQ